MTEEPRTFFYGNRTIPGSFCLLFFELKAYLSELKHGGQFADNDIVAH
jgi:hypothetical protein